MSYNFIIVIALFIKAKDVIIVIIREQITLDY